MDLPRMNSSSTSFSSNGGSGARWRFLGGVLLLPLGFTRSAGGHPTSGDSKPLRCSAKAAVGAVGAAGDEEAAPGREVDASKRKWVVHSSRVHLGRVLWIGTRIRSSDMALSGRRRRERERADTPFSCS